MQGGLQPVLARLGNEDVRYSATHCAKWRAEARLLRERVIAGDCFTGLGDDFVFGRHGARVSERSSESGLADGLQECTRVTHEVIDPILCGDIERAQLDGGEKVGPVQLREFGFQNFRCARDFCLGPFIVRRDAGGIARTHTKMEGSRGEIMPWLQVMIGRNVVRP
jgi:hypothetical protein